MNSQEFSLGKVLPNTKNHQIFQKWKFNKLDENNNLESYFYFTDLEEMNDIDPNHFDFFKIIKTSSWFSLLLSIFSFCLLIYNFSFLPNQNTFQRKFNSSFLQKTSLTNKVSYRVNNLIPESLLHRPRSISFKS